MSDIATAGTGVADGRWPGELGSRLTAWELGRRLRVVASKDPKVDRLVAAAERWEPVECLYFGGAEPGERRRLTPSLVFVVSGYRPVDVTGIGHRRRELRTFGIDRRLLIECDGGGRREAP